MSTLGCTTWVVQKSGEHYEKDVGFYAQMPEGWMNYKPAYGMMVTRDGYSLNHISVMRIKFLQKLSNTKKRFEKGMLLSEVLEIEMDRIQSDPGIFYFEVLKNEPIIIDGREAYRLEYQYRSENGLMTKAVQCGFIYDKYVYRIMFQAAALHYYDATLPDFTNFLKSFKLRMASSGTN